jgi:hypothetical protein
VPSGNAIIGTWFDGRGSFRHFCVKRDLVSVKRDLVSVKKELVKGQCHALFVGRDSCRQFWGRHNKFFFVFVFWKTQQKKGQLGHAAALINGPLFRTTANVMYRVKRRVKVWLLSSRSLLTLH